MIISVTTKALGITLVLLGCTMVYVLFLKHKILQQSISSSLKDKELNNLQERLIGNIKDNIVQRNKDKNIIDKDDIKAKVLFNQYGVEQLANELKIALNHKHTSLIITHPDITELDLLVIDLLIIGMDNDDICEIIKMEKRTLYRRRQLIAKRIGISSNDIESFVRAL